MAQIADNVFEAVLVFFMYWPGWLYALVVGVALALVIKRPAIWMVSVIAASYAYLATYTIFHIGPIIEANTVGQILSVQGLFGALVTLTIFAVISAVAKFIINRTSSRTLETPS